jgi:hypothetical protein
MRKQAHGLAALVTSHLEKDPMSGDVFIFVNQGALIVKILMWDVSGYWVACKRLERGRFAVRGKCGAVGAKGCHLLSVAEVMRKKNERSIASPNSASPSSFTPLNMPTSAIAP